MAACSLLDNTFLMFERLIVKKVCNHSGSVHKSCDPFLLLFLKWVPKLPPMLFWWTEVKFCQFLANLQSTVIVTSSDTGLPTPLSAVQVYLGIQYSTVQYSTGTFSGHCEISRSPYDSSMSVCLGLVLTCRRVRRWHCGEWGSCCYHCTEEWDSAEILINYFGMKLG